MMHLIIDSGATKTEYLFTDGNSVLLRFANRGFNCNYVEDDEIRNILVGFVTVLSRAIEQLPEKISFFGAGCGNTVNAERIRSILKTIFPINCITVDSDLKSACIALCNQDAGWIGILGTGSSSCFYNGNEIVEITPSLGYLLGDEGSGTHIGKLFVAKYLENAWEDTVRISFEKEFQIDRNSVLQKLYQQPNPNRFLSSIAPFLLQHIDNEMIKGICYDAFEQFFQKQSRYFQHHYTEISLSGSIAFYFQDIIAEVAQKQNICLKKIIASPMDLFNNYPEYLSNFYL
ncbi:MAG: hypothetical protein LBU51_01915 [Bacteroidales bacterium]|jgi:N-acetylglucosamine kinase-like BadF-type ATPase|nr:hypothetical protein [Bacteroidales bacterium]